MKKFLFFIVGFIIALGLFFYAMSCFADGSSDAMYEKFTTPKQTSLILGGSRAAQGLHPSQINKGLNRSDVYNYAFQNPSSPYGAIYLKSIKNKLENSNGKGLFILEVNPWNMTQISSKDKKHDKLTEIGGFMDRTSSVAKDPNLEYLVESFNQKFVTIFENRFKKGQDRTYFIEEDGWLHVSIIADSIGNYARLKHKVNIYTKKLKERNGFSNYRLESLVETITYLKHHGQVFVVRLPVSKDMLTLEEKLLPEFDLVIDSIAKENNVEYINKTDLKNNYSYVDGHHLDVLSGARFSKDLAQSIKKSSFYNLSD